MNSQWFIIGKKALKILGFDVYAFNSEVHSTHIAVIESMIIFWGPMIIFYCHSQSSEL